MPQKISKRTGKKVRAYQRTGTAKSPAKRTKRAALGANGVNALLGAPGMCNPGPPTPEDLERWEKEITLRMAMDLACAVARGAGTWAVGDEAREIVRTVRLMQAEVATPTQSKAAKSSAVKTPAEGSGDEPAEVIPIEDSLIDGL